MNCIKCNKNNPHQANYCINCGYHFTDDDKTNDYKKGFTGLLYGFRKIYELIHLNFIVSNPIFKCLSIILILIIGAYGIYSNGNNIKVVDGNTYTYQYNTNDKEYYVYTTDEEVKLNIYTLGNTKDIKLDYIDENNNIISSNTYNDINDISLVTNTYNDNHYLLSINNKDIIIYVYNSNMIER